MKIQIFDRTKSLISLSALDGPANTLLSYLVHKMIFSAEVSGCTLTFDLKVNNTRPEAQMETETCIALRQDGEMGREGGEE